ncbi:MAG TPA: hypothetical protein VHR47_02715 [Bacillota bacterium]|jgi:hypothetical protein|nr:hypothetical protein [Bacillota bacterium]
MANIVPIYFILCDDVRLEINGKVSIIGEFSQIEAPNLPMTVPLCVLTKWSGIPGASGVVELQMQAPDNQKPVTIGQQPFAFEESDFDFAHAGTVNKFPWQFQSPGIHFVRVLLNGELQGEIQLVVRLAEQQNQQENQYPLN